MAVVLLSADLMAASRVEGAARRVGANLRTVADVEAAAACCAERPVALVIVDLGTTGLNVATVVQRLKADAGENPPQIVAFGPHVHEALLAAADAAGCDEVLSRGEFLAQLDAVFARHSGET
jgi:DNA-binding response OmpR family regulator